MRQLIFKDIVKPEFRWFLAGVAAALALVFQVYTFSKSQEAIAEIETQADDLSKSASELLGLIGYSGVIHDFKNCLLRPAEPDYCAQADDKAVRAQRLAESLEKRLLALEIASDGLPNVREMIATYRGRLPRVLALHAEGRPIAEIDAAVRFDDLPATEEIRAMQRRVSEVTGDRLAQIDRGLRSQILTGSIAFLIVLVWLILAMRREMRVRRLLERERELSSILDTVAYGVIGLAHGKIVATLNPAARHMLGARNDPTPFPWPDDIQFLDPADLQPLDASRDPIERLLAGGALDGDIHIMTRRSVRTGPLAPEVRYVRLSFAPVVGSERGVNAVLALEDVTEAQMRRQQMERASRLDALGQLTGGIAHDFNNILATIQSALQLVLLRGVDGEAKKWTEASLSAVRRGAALAGRLLAFARKQPATATSRKVDEIFADMMALLRPTIENAIDLRSVVRGDDLVIYCDQGQLENAIVNLVINSRDAIIREMKGDTIVIEARGVTDLAEGSEAGRADPNAYIAEALSAESGEDLRRDDGRSYRYVEIAVTDNGPGMTPEVKSRAVDPFFSTKGTNSGTGLGLSMVYGFVQQSGGELRIYAEAEHGATVRMILPRGVPGGVREGPVERAPQPKGAGQVVLVVEDEPDLLTAFSALVASLGYKVLSATNGAAALSILESGDRVDLLLTDIVMPGGVGGFELAERARALRPELPVIYMSGYTGFSDREGTVRAPMLAKPCPPTELARALRAELAQD